MCVRACVLRVSEGAGSGRGHLSRLICRESVTSDHMVESVALGQGQDKTFPQLELVIARQTQSFQSVPPMQGGTELPPSNAPLKSKVPLQNTKMTKSCVQRMGNKKNDILARGNMEIKK